MTDVDSLNLWYEEELVGRLWNNDLNRIGFRYDPNWLKNETAFPISLQLALTDREYSADSGLAHRFFANLLPEGPARINIVNSLKISNSDFPLLRAIGGECAGALNILAEGSAPRKSHEWTYTRLTDEELEKLILRRGQIYNFTNSRDEPVRLSLAGAQDKCPMLVRGGEYYLPNNEAPTSHILKFQLADYRHVPAYETVLMKLAKAIGLPVADIELKALGGLPADAPDKTYVLIKRYDRIYDSEKKALRRLHQEDFCQALGFGYEKKYESGGGPRFADCLKLIRDLSIDPIADTLSLLNWQIFNLLAGNSDGHAKNLSILYADDKSLRLAPFYDLVCTRAIDRISTRLAFSIGGQFDPGVISKKNWLAFAQANDIGSSYLLNTVKTLAEQIYESLPAVLENFEASYGKYEALQRVKTVIHQQIKHTLS